MKYLVLFLALLITGCGSSPEKSLFRTFKGECTLNNFSTGSSSQVSKSFLVKKKSLGIVITGDFAGGVMSHKVEQGDIDTINNELIESTSSFDTGTLQFLKIEKDFMKFEFLDNSNWGLSCGRLE